MTHRGLLESTLQITAQAVVKLKSLPGAKKQGFCCFTTGTLFLSLSWKKRSTLRYTENLIIFWHEVSEKCSFFWKEISLLKNLRVIEWFEVFFLLPPKCYFLKHVVSDIQCEKKFLLFTICASTGVLFMGLLSDVSHRHVTINGDGVSPT